MARSNHGGKKPGKGQQKYAAERKRDDRAIRNAYRKKRRDESYLADDYNNASFSNQLQLLGLKLRDIPGDGNCLFRALGDQINGHSRNHLKHRAEAVEYIRKHRDFFEPFMEDNISFEKHLSNLSNSGTYAGNDSIVAFARRHDADVVIHQLNSPVWKVSGSDSPNARELHIAYHNGDHYSSVRKMSDNDNTPTNFRTLQVTRSAEASTSREGRKKADCPAEASNYPRCNVDEDSMADLLLYVMQQSGCQDLEQTKEALEDASYDVEAAISFLLHLEELSERLEPGGKEPGGKETGDDDDDDDANELWSAGGTGSRIFGGLEGESLTKTEPNRTEGQGSGTRGKGAQAKAKLNSRQKKQKEQLEKQQQKQQQKMDRHRQRVLGERGAQRQEEADPDATIVVAGEMGTLSI